MKSYNEMLEVCDNVLSCNECYEKKESYECLKSYEEVMKDIKELEKFFSFEEDEVLFKIIDELYN